MSQQKAPERSTALPAEAELPQSGGREAALSRRQLIALGLAADLAGGLPHVAEAEAAAALSPEAAIERLTAGNRRFVAREMTAFHQDLAALRRHTEMKQEPFAAVLSCADSRVPVELIFDQSIGHLFVTRVAGNIATSDIIASLEYGVAVLGARLILVLAHANCGAVKAALAGKAVPGQISALYPYLRAAVLKAGPDPEATARANAIIQAEILAGASPVIGERVAKGALKVVPAYYSVATGEVTLLS